MAKDILKEAIADAKAVREVALANAKAALEEAFTPKLQSMLSARLSEDMDEDMDETYGMEEDMDETMYDETKDMDETMYDEDMDEAKDDMDEDMDETSYGMEEDLDETIDLEEILNELGLEEELAEETVAEGEEDVTEGDEKVDEVKKKKSKKDDDEDEEVKKEAVGYPNHRADQVQKVKHDASDIHLGLNEGEEFDLDALLKEIESLEEKDDVDEGSQDSGPFRGTVAGKPKRIKTKVDTYAGDAAKEAKDDMEEMNHSMEETEMEEAMGPDATELATLAATAAGVMGAAFMAAGGKEGLKQSIKTHGPIKGVAKFLGSTGAGAGIGKDVREELEETKEALETVRAELNEVNLLNSKLLYVNRIFKANQLDESQKLRVVETLDKAESTKEAKLIYETIKDTFNVAKSNKVSRKAKAKTIKEGLGMASKAAGTSTAPKKEVISESANMVSRFQKLANIKINQ